MVDYGREVGKKLKHPMKSQHCILVCIDDHPKTGLLLRAAAKKARELKLPWLVLYVESPEHYVTDADARARVLKFLTLAKNMGAEIEHLESSNVVDGIVSYVQHALQSEIPVKYMIFGQTAKEGFFSEIRQSYAEKVTRTLRQHPVEVQIIPLTSRHYKASWFDRFRLSDAKPREIIFALISVLVSFVCAELILGLVPDIEWQIQTHNVMALFIIACVVSALRYGLLAGLTASIAAFMTLNYYYIRPLNDFGINHSGDAVGLMIFLASTVGVSFMGAYSLSSNAALIRKEKRSQALYRVHRLASEAKTHKEALGIMHEELKRLLEMDVAFFAPRTMNKDVIELCYPAHVELGEKDMKARDKCWNELRTSGLGTSSRYGSDWRFEPLVTANGEQGVLGVKVPVHIRLDASFGRLISALADQAAAILERIELTNLMTESKMNEEREKLRAMLLSSVSHDLKTPLASVIGSLSVYHRMMKSGRLTDDIAHELTDTALEEAQRLDSFISNILDMTRIESGDIGFKAAWVDSRLIIAEVKKRLKLRLKNHTLTVEEPDVPYEILLDKMLTEQVLQNIMDNAVKYSPKQSAVTVKMTPTENGGFSFIVQDEGGGIPEDKWESVFDKYERLKLTDSQVAGTGLGLAISKAIVEKQGGNISVRNHDGGGAEFTINFKDARPLQEERGEAA